MMSMRSTIHGSTGKVWVPAPVYIREPSNRVITEPWPSKPRAERAVLPLPGVATEVMPGERVTAS
ncbi:hypothetical protein D3C75_1268190 [compost metagenome]